MAFAGSGGSSPAAVRAVQADDPHTDPYGAFLTRTLAGEGESKEPDSGAEISDEALNRVVRQLCMTCHNDALETATSPWRGATWRRPRTTWSGRSRVDVNQRDHNGYTALHHAAARGDNESVLYLVERGADVTVLSREGQTVADMANGPVQRISPYPATVRLLEELGSENNNNCMSC